MTALFPSSRPRINVKVLPRFPGKIIGQTGIDIDVSGGVATARLAINELTENNNTDPIDQFVLSYDESSGEHAKTPFDAFAYIATPLLDYADQPETRAGDPDTLKPVKPEEAVDLVGYMRPLTTRNGAASRSVDANVLEITTIGYAAAGDGGGARYKRVVSEPSHAGKFQTADGSWWEIAEVEINVRMMGAKLDWVSPASPGTDDTLAWNNAIGIGRPLYFPAGNSRITGKVALQTGQSLRGSGRLKSVFCIGSDFNLAATAVLQLGSGEPGSQVSGVGLNFDQPKTPGTTRANLIQYPPAINGANIPRFTLDDIRIREAWVGIDATGNSGGFDIGFVECSAYSYGLKVNGTLDFAKVGRFHFWPFGIGAAGTVDGDIYRDGQVIAVSIGDADGLVIETLQLFRGRMERFGTSTVIPLMINNLELDGDGSRLIHSGGYTKIKALYSTKNGVGVAPADSSVSCSGGVLEVDNVSTNGGEGTHQLLCSGGRFTIKGGTIAFSNSGFNAVRVTSGRMTVKDVAMDISTNQTRTAPYIEQTAGSIIVTGVQFNAIGTGSGDAIKAGADGAGNYVARNIYSGWTTSFPSTYLGFYAADVTRLTGVISHNGTVDSSVLPAGVTLSRLGAGNYQLTHNISASVPAGMRMILTPMGTGDVTAVWDTANSNTLIARIRTFSAGAATDVPVGFVIDKSR